MDKFLWFFFQTKATEVKLIKITNRRLITFGIVSPKGLKHKCMFYVCLVL